MGKGMSNNYWGLPVKVSAIWLTCILVFFCLFKLDLQSSSSRQNRNSHQSELTDAQPAGKRSVLYEEMAADLRKNGAHFLQQGKTSQSLNLSDLFTFKDGTVRPVLRAMDPPVRANVLYLSPQFSVPISEAVKSILLPYFDGAIWFQDSNVYHFSMFHASHHIAPVQATKTEVSICSKLSWWPCAMPATTIWTNSFGIQVEAEADSVKAVARALCPLNIILDRVVLMSSGVLLGCWQVVSGDDPVTIRARLKAALPNAPKKQLYNEAMLHTSFARLLGPAKNLTKEESNIPQLEFFGSLVRRLNNKISGDKATVSELWYVEEQDLLALALNGRMKIRKFPLTCSSQT